MYRAYKTITLFRLMTCCEGLSRSSSSSTVVIAIVAATVFCVIVVMTTTVCVNCLQGNCRRDANTCKWFAAHRYRIPGMCLTLIRVLFHMIIKQQPFYLWSYSLSTFCRIICQCCELGLIEAVSPLLILIIALTLHWWKWESKLLRTAAAVSSEPGPASVSSQYSD